MKKMYSIVLLVLLLGTTTIAQKNVDGIVQNYLNASAGEGDLKATDVTEWKITDVVPSLNPEIQHVYVKQLFQGIPVQNGTYKLTIKNGQVTYGINQFAKNIAEKTAGVSGSLSAENAILKVVSKHNLKTPSNLSVTKSSGNVFEYANSGISLEPIKVEKTYLAIGDKMYLTWNVSLYQLDAQHWWNVNVDASSGEILQTTDWVISCSYEDPNHSEHGHSATTPSEETLYGPVRASESAIESAFVGGGSYNVYPLGIESPSHGNRAIITDPANALASPFGWHDTNGAAGAEFTTTRGNNVLAQEDTNGNNGFGVSPNGGTALNFNFPLNLNNNPSTFLPAATTNLFYWNNIMHDVWYQYGFTEAAGNFQENNYGKGGLGSDSVNADAQDGSQTNNANFATPPDGGNPRMQMFLFTNPTRDGDLDNVIIAHEYGHGISTRLVGGPGTNALGGSEQMGEGWSDWFGLVMTIRPGDDRNTPRGVGTYAIGQPATGSGIRPTRYSPNFSVNSTTYDNVSNLIVPHGVGYGFATILWDMTWDLIDLEGYDSNQYTGNGGNNIAMALVIEGLKNTANNPGYVSGRNGILQADQDLFGGQYNCLIWDAFARRGVGVDAVENSNGGTNTNSDQISSFVSGCSGPPPPASCSSTVSNFPYTEGFENTIGAWSQDSSDSIDWTVNSGGTPSDNTGPASANEGSFYIYVEASGEGAGFPNKTATLNSPCFNLAGVNQAEATFSYQMTGNAVGVVRLEARDDSSQTWTELWSRSGDQGAAWQNAVVSLSAYSGSTQLRFRATTGNSWQGDIAIDGFTIEGTATADTQAPTTPTNLTVTGVTTTTVALTWTPSTDNVGVTAYDVFLGSSNLGEVAATSANITGLVEGTTYQFRVRAKDAAGNVSGNSNTVTATTDTTAPPAGCVATVSIPFGANFESGFGQWSQETSEDDIDWTRNSGTTPSNNTGPSTGSVGDFYLYVEASGNGNGFPNKRAILNSPCFDLTGETDALISFDYHMFGSTDGGRIDLEASTDAGASWSSIWNATGNQGNQWNNVNISLDAFTGGTVQLRFNRLTGGTWQSDVALDFLRVTAGGDTDLPSGYCTSNGNNSTEEYIARVQIGSINNASGRNAAGYQDFTNLSTNLSGSSTITITPEWPGTTYDEGYAVFIDWNRDGDFADAGETAFTRAPTQAASITGTISVPLNASEGATLMRVVMGYNAIPSACGSFNFGEVEDYIVNVSSSAGFGPSQPQETISEFATTAVFSIFPNPVTQGRLSINLEGFEATGVTIYNLLGQVVHKGDFEKTLDVSRLEEGVYIVQVETGTSKMIKRFIKK